MPDLALVLTNSLTDLDELIDTVKWAHSTAYWPPRAGDAGPVVSRSAPGSKPPACGNDWSRAVLREAAAYVTGAEVRVGVALAAIGMTSVPVRGNPSLDAGDLSRWRTAHAGLRWGVSTLLQAVEADTIPREHRRGIRAVLAGTESNWMGSACWRIRMVNGVLTEAFRGTQRPSGDFIVACKICRIRDVAAKRGGRCETCATYKARRGGERPTELDAAVRDAPIQAKARRLARNEGWGAA